MSDDDFKYANEQNLGSYPSKQNLSLSDDNEIEDEEEVIDHSLELLPEEDEPTTNIDLDSLFEEE